MPLRRTIEEKERYLVPAIERASAILDVLEKSDKPLTLSEIARHFKWPKSSIFRILVTLEKYNFVEQNYEAATFTLGNRLTQLGIAKLNKMNLGFTAYRYLEELANRSGESVYLAILSNWRVVIIQRVDSPNVWAMVTKLGLYAPVHCTASGQVLISEVNSHELERAMKKIGLKKYTNRTITRFSELKRRLDEIKRKGYVIVDREYNPEIVAIAAPIRNAWGKIAAALLIVLQYKGSETRARARELVPLIKEYARRISNELGYSEK
jgi:DNA-binding IclR family transcriptional regulator